MKTAPPHSFQRSLPIWLWPVLLIIALQAASLDKGFWGAHGEARRAEVAREVLQDGHWLVPTLLGEPFITKPPLLYWSCALSMGAFGMHDWAARLPAILATLGSWFAMISLGRSYAAELRLSRGEEGQEGVLAAVALLGMPLVLAMGLNAETEPLLLCFSLAAVAAVLRLPPRGQVRSIPARLLPGLFLALGFMVKGPLGWLFPLFGILAFELGLPTGRRRLGWSDAALALAVNVFVALPWFLAVLARQPDAMRLWLGESVARLSDPDFQVHREAWWYYLPNLLLFLPPLLFLGRGAWRDRIGRIPLLWLGTGVLFLSLAGSKRAHYLLSLAPAAALLPLTAAGMRAPRHIIDRALRMLAPAPPVLAGMATLWLLIRGVIPIGLWPLATMAGALAGGWWLARRQAGNGLEHWSLSLLLTLIIGGPVLLPALDAYRSPRIFYEEAAAMAVDGAPLLNWRNDRYSASFYLKRAVPPARDESDLARLAPLGAWLLSQEQDLRTLARPHDVRLRREQNDPFIPGRRRVWVLARLETLHTALQPLPPPSNGVISRP